MTQLILLGSTGSIGCQCLDVVRNHPDLFEIEALATNRRDDLLWQQVQEFKPSLVAIIDAEAAARFPQNQLPEGTQFFQGPNALCEMVQAAKGDVAVIATVGAAGFRPTFEAIRQRKHIALANKEVLAMAGSLLMQEARKYQVPIVPIDSEHSAILQCLQSGQHEEVHKIILTASGGPFRGKTPEEFENVSVREALKHPTWTMGAKITIDSATLFNKGLEVIEAHHLFNQSLEKIDVIVHPQSIIHSMVEFIDGSVIAQMGDADMRTPIQYALSYPARIERSGRKLNLLEISQLTFFPPDLKSFRCLALAYDAARQGGTLPAYLSVANEVLVDAFLNERISFGMIPRYLEVSLNHHKGIKDYSLDDIYHTDEEARRITQEIIRNNL
ncbi:MAG: 1-deoxy-D-xylulose-5-phosphate reductoisomerase [bacterium]|jgi:1-deoxy-D-xylulose-5-phosphate reductoisomerase